MSTEPADVAGPSHHRIAGRRARDDPNELKEARADQHSRLRNAVIDLVIVAALLYAASKLQSQFSGVGTALSHASAGPIVAAVGLEVCSEVGFVLAFVMVMDPERDLFCTRHLGREIAWTELGASVLLPAGAAGGPGVAAWALNKLGMAGTTIAQRSFVLLFLNSAVDFSAVIVFGVTMYVGLLAGSTDPLLTILPAGIALAVLVFVLLVPRVVLPLAGRTSSRHHKISLGLEAVGRGVTGTVAILRSGDWRLVGPIAYWALDNAVLYMAFVGLGHAPPVGVVVMSYLIGALGGSIPLPAGIGSILGMVGLLVAFGVPTGDAAAAVLIFQAISIGVPTVGGTIAFLLLRRSFKQPTSAAASG
jgi:putative heme transporter